MDIWEVINLMCECERCSDNRGARQRSQMKIVYGVEKRHRGVFQQMKWKWEKVNINVMPEDSSTKLGSIRLDGKVAFCPVPQNNRIKNSWREDLSFCVEQFLETMVLLWYQ